jgi:hypothetical protein
MSDEMNVSESSRKPTVKELSDQLQQQLFEIGRAAYLYETNRRNMMNNCARLAVELERAQKEAAASVSELATKTDTEARINKLELVRE